MEKLFTFLNSVQPLSPSLETHLYKNVQQKLLVKKSFLLRPDQVSSSMCFITKGLLRAYYIKDGIEISSWFMKENDVCVSIESFYQQKPGYEYIQAVEDTELFYIDHALLEEIYRIYPEFNFTARILTIKYLCHWAQQLYAIRFQSAAERYDWLLEFHPELLLRVPQKYIASYLDITAETLSKIRAQKNF
jgi:CRP-like cAMP-binding protein